jgi:hypothetical protein
MVETQAGRDALEDSQLLSRADRGIDDDSSTVSPAVPFHLSRVTKFCMLLFLLLEMSNAVLTVPLLSLLERRICNDYYVYVEVESDSCKAPQIQGELGKLKAMQSIFNTFSGISHLPSTRTL